ncbi:hypothetical protein [Nonomuraea recticatena]
MLRLFKLAKTSAIKSRSQAINQLKAILIAAEPALRDSLTGLSNPKLIRRCAKLTVDTPEPPLLPFDIHRGIELAAHYAATVTIAEIIY